MEDGPPYAKIDEGIKNSTNDASTQMYISFQTALENMVASGKYSFEEIEKFADKYIGNGGIIDAFNSIVSTASQGLNEIEYKSVATFEKLPKDLTDAFNTALSPEEEAKFKEWFDKLNSDIAQNGQEPYTLADYDFKGFWKKYVEAANEASDEVSRQVGDVFHFTDEFKKPIHITFSTDSIYSTEKMLGGVWEKVEKIDEASGKLEKVWTYIPSAFVLANHGALS